MEVLQYLAQFPHAQDKQSIKTFLQELKSRKYNLTKAETIQLVNSKPTTLPVLYLVSDQVGAYIKLIEECDARLTPEQMEDLLQLCTLLVPKST